MIRVGYIAGEPNPSRAPHLDAISRVQDLELTVIYAAPTVHRRTWTLDLHHEPVFLEGPSLPLTWLLHHDYPLTPSIWPLLERERFDCLVIGGWSLLATQLAIVWARRRRVPYLLISENHFLEPRPLWIRALKRAVLPPIVRAAAGHLVTGSLAHEHVLAYGARPETITIFPNTVDVEAWGERVRALRAQRAELRSRLAIDPNAVAILQVSRLIPVKGVDELIDAVAAAGELTDVPLQLVLAGDGPLRAALERRARARGLAATFLGTVDGERLLEAYAAADVFALLSRRETWGIVVNEAMASGLPVVASNRVGAAADLVVPGENGEVVNSGDIGGIARAFAALASDRALREQSGLRSLELIEPWSYGPSVETFAAAVRAAVVARRAVG